MHAGIPYSDVNLKTHAAEAPHWTSYSSLSEVTSLSLEFSFLARATGHPCKYYHSFTCIFVIPELVLGCYFSACIILLKKKLWHLNSVKSHCVVFWQGEAAFASMMS